MKKLIPYWPQESLCYLTTNPAGCTNPPAPSLTFWTSRWPSGDSLGTNTKIDCLMNKMFFRCYCPCFIHHYCFLLEKNKDLNGDIQGTFMGLSCRTSRAKWWHILGASAGRWSYMFFKFNLETYLLTLTGYSRLCSEL